MSSSIRMRAMVIGAGVALACGPGKSGTVDNSHPSEGIGGNSGAASGGTQGAPLGGSANALGGAQADGGRGNGGSANGGKSLGGSANGGRNSGGATADGGKDLGSSVNGGKSGSQGGASAGGSTAGGSSAGTAGQTSTSVCDNPSLVWRSANKTNYTSYPDPGSEECVKFNGCTWAGQFAGCDGVKSEAWVMAHNIVAAFPDFATLKLHDLCLRKGTKTIVVTVFDTCGDSDCSGCCTQNKGTADQLIDVESYTDARWGVPDGKIEWADLGASPGDPCR